MVMDTNIGRSVDATANVTQSLEERENRMQAQLNRLETGHARVTKRITEDVERNEVA